MKRMVFGAALVLLVGVASLVGCKAKMVTVTTGEIVLCTEGELVSDTTESKEVRADEVGDYGVTTEVVTCDFHAKLASLYTQAQDAIAAGDLDAASRALAEIVATDPLYRRAGSQLTDITAGRTPIPDGAAPAGGGTTTVPDSERPGEESPTGPILNLAHYVPDALPGFVGQGLIADPLTLTRDYLPSSAGAATRLVIVVEQFQDADAAKAELDAVIKPAYSGGASSLDVSGKAGYYGQASTVSVVAFTDGGLLVVLEMATEGAPAALKTQLVELAREVAK